MPDPKPEQSALLTDDGRVYVRTAEGEVASLPQDQVGSFLDSQLGSLATHGDIAANEERKRLGEGIGNELQTFGESALSGATVGLSDVAIKMAAPEYAQEMVKRRELNPVSDVLGQGTGLLGSALLTGGSSAVAKGAGVVGAPARGLMGLGAEAGSAVAQALGKEAATGVLGRAAITGAEYATAGAVEGALFGAAKAATDDFLTDHEITAERIIAGGGQGALGGALTGGLLGAGGSLAADTFKKALIPALKRAIDSDSIDDFVNQRAYKAALGGRNVAAVRKADAYLEGGPAGVGETLLREGIVTPSSTTESIAAMAAARADEIGAKIDDVYTRLDALGKPASATKLWKRIDDDVLAPLRKSPVMRDVAESVESKLGYLKESLSAKQDVIVRGSDRLARAGDDITYRQMWELSKDLGRRAGFDRVPGVANPAADAMKDAQRTIRRYLQENGDELAKAAGGDDLIAELRDYNKTFSHVKHGQEIAEAAIKRDQSNALLSPTDKGVGMAVALGDAITGGGISASTIAYGLASGAVAKFFRERGAAMFAGNMYSLRQAPKLLKTARAGETAMEKAVGGFINGLKVGRAALSRAIPATAATAAAKLAKADNYEEAVKNVAEVSNPDSPRRRAMKGQTEAVRTEYPALADAMESQTQRIGDFLAKKAGELSVKTRPGDPFGQLRKPRHDPGKAAKLAKYIDAAQNPQHALDRIGKGQIRREDIETLREVYPRLYARLVEQVMVQIGDVKKLPSYDARVRLSHLLNTPADPTMRPEYIQLMQQTAASGAQEQAQGAEDGGTLSPSRRRAPEISGIYATRSQDLVGGIK